MAPEADGRHWVDFEAGDRSETPFLRVYERLPDAELYRSDAHPVYRAWLPPERHTVGRGGAVNRAVNRSEGLHSLWRGRLNRLMRRTDDRDAPRAWGCWRTPWPWSAGAGTAKSIPPYVENTPNRVGLLSATAAYTIVSLERDAMPAV